MPSSSTSGPAVAAYPTTGGIAIENLGTQRVDDSNPTYWPPAPSPVPVVLGDTSLGITYSATGGTSPTNNFTVGGVLTNGATSQAIAGGVIKCGVRFHTFGGDTSFTIRPYFWCPDLNTPEFIQAPNNVIFKPETAAAGVRYEFTLPIPSNQPAWAPNADFRMVLWDGDTGDRPYSADIEHVRITFGSDEDFEPTGDVVYPTTGGIALTDWYGEAAVEEDPNLDVAWPSDIPQLHGETAGWEYTQSQTVATTVTSQTAISNRLLNNTGTTITPRRVDIDFTLTSIEDGELSNFSPRIIVRKALSSTTLGSGDDRFAAIDVTGLVLGANTLQLPLETTEFTIADGEGFAFLVTETGDTQGPRFHFSVQAVRISFTTDEFVAMPGGGTMEEINVDVSTDPQTVRLSQLRNVDDGEET